MFLLSLTFGVSAQWEGRTKHKPVKKMSRSQIKKAQSGKSFYFRNHGKMKRRSSW